MKTPKTLRLQKALFGLLALALSAPLWSQTADNIHPAAAMEVRSTTKGFLPPRMTTAHRNTLTNTLTPTEGLLIYNTSTGKLEVYSGGSGWVSLGLVSVTLDRLFDANNDTSITVDKNQDGAANTILFETNNTDRMIIDDSGNVGIGTGTPNERLYVAGNARITGQLKDSSGNAGTLGQILSATANGTDWITPAKTDAIQDTDTDTKIQLEESNDEDKIRFDTGGTERMIIDNSGNVGIGTGAPQARLDVNGISRFRGTINTSNQWISGDGGAEGIVVTGNGNVGIGTSSPQATLDVNGISRFRGTINTSNQWISGDGGAEGIIVRETGNVGIGTSNPQARLEVSGTSEFNGTIKTNGYWISGDGHNEGIVVASNGNVGIGTSAPNERLYVAGNARITGQLKDSNGNAGTSGQILSTTGTGTDWIDAGSGMKVVTQAEQDALTGQSPGTLVYNSTTQQVNVWVGTHWAGLLQSSVSARAAFTWTKNSGRLLQNSPLYGDIKVTITNNKATAVSLPQMAGADLRFSGITGANITIASVSNGGAGTLAAGASHVVTYNISGDPNLPTYGTLKVNFSKTIDGAVVLAAANIVVDTQGGSFLHNGITYRKALGAGGRIWLDRNIGATQLPTSRLAPFPAARGTAFSYSQALSACPAGYKLPNESEWQAEINSWISKTADGAFASGLKLVSADHGPSSGGSYSFNRGYMLYFVNTGGTSVTKRVIAGTSGTAPASIQNSTDTSISYPVRCIKN